jgi:hypothetical protein
MATMNQCALSFNGISVVLCASIVVLIRFWCLGISVFAVKNESEQSNAAVCEGKWGRMSRIMASSSAAEFMCVCGRRLWTADAWGILSRVMFSLHKAL